jgi:hypothetical protein
VLWRLLPRADWIRARAVRHHTVTLMTTCSRRFPSLLGTLRGSSTCASWLAVAWAAGCGVVVRCSERECPCRYLATNQLSGAVPDSVGTLAVLATLCVRSRAGSAQWRVWREVAESCLAAT